MAGRNRDPIACTAPPQNTPPSSRLRRPRPAVVNVKARRPRRACDLRCGCLKSEASGPMTANWRLAARSCDGSSLESYSVGCPESGPQSDTEDHGRSCFESNGVCTPTRNGPRNLDHSRQNSGRSSARRCVLSCRWNSLGGSRHHRPGSSSEDDFEGDLESSSGGGPGGAGLSCQPSS